MSRTARPRSLHRRAVAMSLALATLGLLVCPAGAGASVRFVDVAKDPDSGLFFERQPSATFATLAELRQESLSAPLDPSILPLLPTRVHGIPGVVIFDPDGDGDLDVYVTNGPGADNSLFVNQLVESRWLRFVDLGASAGAAATSQDSTGACAGDLDNDGDPDLLVLGRSEANRLFENVGGSFRERPGSGLGGGSFSSLSCSLGDVDGDGLLDVVVSNTFDFSNLLPIFVEPLALNHPNQLFRNRGGLSFEDVSESSGIRGLQGLPPGAATISWATAMVDVDLDGDMDIVFADDQAVLPDAGSGGLDRGLLRVLLNDGAGRFVDRPIALDQNADGSWMGLAFGDLNCDGAMDVLGSNFGDYGLGTFELGEQATRWFYGNGDGTFSEPGLGGTVASVFGWGNAIADFDNDGDQDMVYHGSLEINFQAVVDNHGVYLDNQACGQDFRHDPEAFDTDHLRRNVQGVAVGDLDRDGFVDVVTAANFVYPETMPLVPSGISWGSPFDGTTFVAFPFVPTEEGMVWNGIDFALGDVTVEINQGRRHRRGVTVRPVGSIGIVRNAAVNREGIGAVVSFRPVVGRAVMMPIQGGSSLGSQHAPEAYFGLGSRPFGTVEVLWPGGVRNRLYGVRRGERILFPEIPCSFDDEWEGVVPYLRCVDAALDDLREGGPVDRAESFRFFSSALRAFFDR